MRQCTGVKGKQTELEFAYALMQATANECSGPLVRLRLRGDAYREIMNALECVAVTDVLRDAAEKGLSDKGGSFQLCARHWFDLTMVVGGMAEAYQNPVWSRLKESLAAMTSRAAGWDYREMENRLTSINRARLAGKNDQYDWI